MNSVHRIFSRASSAVVVLAITSVFIVTTPAFAIPIFLDTFEGAQLFSENPTAEAMLTSVAIRPSTDAINNGGGDELTGATCLQQNGTFPNNGLTRQVGFSCLVPIQLDNTLTFLLNENNDG